MAKTFSYSVMFITTPTYTQLLIITCVLLLIDIREFQSDFSFLKLHLPPFP